MVMLVAVSGFPASAADAADAPQRDEALEPTEPGEQPEARTRTSTTVRLDDGRLQTTLHSAPIHYAGDDGKWRPISNKLVASTTPGYALENEANAFKALFKEHVEDRHLAVRAGDADVQFTLEGAARSQGRARGVGMSYGAVFPGVDLSYDVTGQAVKETLVLHRAAVPTTYRFRATSASPLRAEKLGDGSWTVFVGGSPSPAFELLAPYAVDANGQGREEGTAELDVRSVASGLTITLTVDPSWLHASERAFPVLLDPTIQFSSTATADWNMRCQGCSGHETSELFVGTTSAGVWRAGAIFDISAIEPGSAISNATLGLYYNENCLTTSSLVGNLGCGTEDHDLDVHAMTAGWTRQTSNSDLRFESSRSASTRLPVTEFVNAQWLQWNITDLTNAWYKGTKPNNGLLVKRRSETLDKSGPRFPSRVHPDPAVRPKLTVTYSESVELDAPETLRSNGAQLRWSRYAGFSGEAFNYYEVHRDSFAGFSPNASTLLARITGRNTTTFTDTTAAPSTGFTYKILLSRSGGTSVSGGQTVTLPKLGDAVHEVQPVPAAGEATQISLVDDSASCANFGSATHMQVGPSASGVSRGLLRFDLRDIPAGSEILTASLSLYHTSVGGTQTVGLHAAEAAWDEGTGTDECTADGATWYDRSGGGVQWGAEGADHATGATSSVHNIAGAAPGWDVFSVTAVAKEWASGARPNHGLVIKASDETRGGKAVVYVADDMAVNRSLRPKLRVTYVDGSAPIAPTVTLTAPVDNTVVSGTGVKVRAVAFDDRRVSQVQFFVKNTLIGTDTSEPYEVTWNSSAQLNTTCTTEAQSTSDHNSLTRDSDSGQAAEHCGAPLDDLRAVAVDDAGNKGSSDIVNVRVANADRPTSAFRLPLNNTTVKGTTVVQVDATADFAKGVKVTWVEVLLDGKIIKTFPGGLATTYEFTWDTLAAGQVAYDGPHVLSSRVFDSFGQMVTSQVNVTVDNTTLTKYRAGFESTTMPTDMVHDPAATVQQTQDVTVTVTNNSDADWNPEYTTVVARWYDTDGNPTSDSRVTAFLGSNAIGAGASRTVTLKVSPPQLGTGVDRAFHELRIDVEERIPPAVTDPPDTPDKYVMYSERGNPPKRQKVETRKLSADRLGLEKYFHYTGEDIGGGMQHLVNVANGNSLLRFTPFSSPGIGLNTLVDITYNSRETKTRSPVGSGFSASISGLVRLGEPLTIHPKKTGAQYVAFTDGDGTTHTFNAVQRHGQTVWDEPAGVHLYLRKFSSTDTDRAWAVTRPDRVTYFFDAEGWPTSVRDGNGNQLTFADATAENASDDPGKPRTQLVRVRDAGGRDYTLAYYTKADNLGAHVRGQVKSIKDHNGSELRFDYYQDGNLLRMTQIGARVSAGDPNVETANRSWTFTYTTSDLSGPAISSASKRVNPDARTPNQSQALFSVRDPRGRETTFTYVSPPNSENRGRVASMTNRTGSAAGVTTYAYDAAAATTTVTAPENRATTFTYDAGGKVTRIVNPKNEATSITWTPDRHVEKITEPTGEFTTYAYDANGYATRQTDQMQNATVLTYEHIDARNAIDIVGDLDPGDTSQYWKPGRTVPHVSQLKTKTSPEGVATTSVPDDYQYDFGYDTRGNLKTVTEPLAGTPATRAVTTYDYNTNGTVSLVTDARQKRAAEYLSYDLNGLPTSVRDALGRKTTFTYDADGLLKSVLDPRHADDLWNTPQANYRSVYTYDTFHRLVRQSSPKSSQHHLGVLIHSGAAYDLNDNVVEQYQPSESAAFTAADTTTMEYDRMDRLTLVTGPDRSVDAKGERTKLEYDAAGRVTRQTAPKGVDTAPVNDYATTFAYDPLDRLLREVRHHVLADGTEKTPSRTHYCYDLAGDLVSVTAPNANLASRTCDASEPRPTHTAVMTYDGAHRLTSREDAKSNTTQYGYDRNGNVTAVTDAESKTTRTTFDQRDMPVEVSEPLTATRRVVSRMEYDAVGNLTRSVHPRGYDIAGASGPFDRYTTSYTYDDADQLVRINLPSSTPPADSTDKFYVHRRYDANGNLRMTSLPTSVLDTSEGLDAMLQDPEHKRSLTRITHFDTGWIRTSDENLAGGDNDPQPRVLFDYTAEGWQKARTPERRDGTGWNSGETMTWTYFDDGQIKERKDEGGQSSDYKYDANNNLREALDGGVDGTAVYPRVIRIEHDPLDRVSVSREREKRPAGDASPKGNFNTTRFDYDLNHNVVTRTENIVEKHDPLTQLEDGRTHTFTYEPNDWLASHLDGGKTSAVDDDRRILNDFDKTGRELRRRIQKRTGADTYTLKQTTDWTWFDNGKLHTLKTSTPSEGVTEQHTVGYIDNGVYVNGHRVTDTFMRKGPDVTSCTSSTCTASYEYDARDKLVKEVSGHGRTTNYTLDPAGNVKLEETLSATGNKTVQMTYLGNQLETVRTGKDAAEATAATAQRHHYDLRGRLDCVVLETQPSTRDTCATATNTPVNAQMLAKYSYDYLDRMIHFRSYRSDGVSTPKPDDDSSYVYDALDRTDTQREKHYDPAGALTSARTTAYSYLGLTSMVASEAHTQGAEQTPGAEIRTRSYGYDAFGHRVSMTDDPAAAGQETKDYTYGYDVHGSVSQLITDGGTVSAAYGYKAYGSLDEGLSGGDTDTPDDPRNPYRYTGKRFDSGSGQLDMGARRFSPDTGRFIQRDQYHDALGDLDLATDPLSGNRYALAAGNPLSFVEVDGHRLDANGDGGAAENPYSPSFGSGSSTSDDGDLWGWERTATSRTGHSPSSSSSSRVSIDRDRTAYVSLTMAGQRFKDASRTALLRGEAVAKHFGEQARRSSKYTLLRAPIVRGLRSDFYNWRGDRALARAGRLSQGLKAASRRLGFIGAGISAWDSATSELNDPANENATDDTRIARAAIKGTASAIGAVGGAALLGGACAATGVGAVLAAGCAAAGGIVGEAVGGIIGEAIGNLFSEDWEAPW